MFVAPVLPLSSTSSLTFFIAGPGLRSSEREEAGGGSLASDQMDASWMDDPDSCLDSLFSARNKATIHCEDVPNFFPLRFFPSRDCCGCRANHAIWSLCKLLQVPVPSQDWCHRHHRMWGGTMSWRRSLNWPVTVFSPLSSGSQTRPSSSLLYLRDSNCLLIINLEHLQPLRQTIHRERCAFRFYNTIRWTLMTKKLFIVYFPSFPWAIF